jgi:hypothetical protein
MFPEKELRGLSPNVHIHVSVSDLYIPTIGRPILLQENIWTDPGNIQISHRHTNVEIGTEAAAIPSLGIHTWDFRCSARHFSFPFRSHVPIPQRQTLTCRHYIAQGHQLM